MVRLGGCAEGQGGCVVGHGGCVVDAMVVW